MSAGGIRIPSTPLVDQVEHTARARRDDAAATGEGLDDHPPEPLGPRGQDEQRRIVELRGDLRWKQLRVILDLGGQVLEKVVDDLLVEFRCRR